MSFRLEWLSLTGTNSSHVSFWFSFQEFLLTFLQTLLSVQKKRESPTANWWGCSKTHSSVLFVWLGALSFSFNKLSPEVYLPKEYYLLNFLQASMQKQVSWFNYQLWRREGTWNSTEIYSSFSSPGFLCISKNTCSKHRLTQLWLKGR